MPNLSEISNGTKVLLGAGLLLLIATFLPWQDYGNELTGALGVDASFTAWRGIGILMGVVLIALLAWVVIQVLNVKLGVELPITEAWLTLGLGIAVFGLALLKLLTIIGEEATIWSYLGVLLAALVAFGAWLRAQELGGIGAAAAPGASGASTTEAVRDDSGGGLTAETPGSTAREPVTMPEAGIVPGAGVATPPPAPAPPPVESAPPAQPDESAAPFERAEPAAPFEPAEPAAPFKPAEPAEPAAPWEPPSRDPLGEPRPDDEPPSRPTGY